jgi:hypothetical protein
MLSGAKQLCIRLRQTKTQILRCAQDDILFDYKQRILSEGSIGTRTSLVMRRLCDETKLWKQEKSRMELAD